MNKLMKTVMVMVLLLVAGAATAQATDRFAIATTTDTVIVNKGDTLKLAMRVADKAAVKHTNVLGTIYSVHLDNAQFDDSGTVSYTVLEGTDQEIALDHPEFRYNLVVSIEWDADAEYIHSVERAFRNLSNYLYDVFDGQVRLDTVRIYDDQDHWLDADVRIWASNVLWPHASIGGVDSSGTGDVVNMPRKWFGSVDDTRNGTYEEPQPLDYNDPDNYRQLAHELGHYLFSFNEEYEFNDSAGRCFSVPDYGFMDYPYSDGGAYASEMSNQSMYTFADCRNTKQYATYGVSCWEMFETDFEGTYGPDNVFVPVRHPDSLDVSENIIPAGYNYIPGPNDDLSAPNYDVGALVQFPQSHSAPSGFTIEVVTHDFQLNRLGGIDVTLRHPVLGGGWSDVYQGQSSDVLPGGMQGGGIYVLGAVTGDKIQASSQYTLMGAPSAALSPAATFNWLVGETTVGLPGDTVRLTLTPIQGSYPLIVRPELHGDTTRVMLDFEQAFNQMPSLELSGSPQNYAFQSDGNSYMTAITDSMSTSGTMTVWCRDAADVPYFFSSAYVIYRSDSGLVGQLASPDGAGTLVPDTAATAPREAIMVVSPYPVLTTGLSPETRAVSAAYGIALDTSVIASHQLTIRYADKDLSAGPNRSVNEGSLTMYRWDDQTSAWIDLVSIQDTANNEVTAAIPGDGVYALLSPDIITDVDNDNSPLPNTFALGQNYPNPFNPTTTIEYSIPRRSRVVIDIFNVLGQSVRRLVDEKAEAGTHSVVWDGRTNGGRPVASGVYLYRITAGELVRTRKMLLLK